MVDEIQGTECVYHLISEATCSSKHTASPSHHWSTRTDVAPLQQWAGRFASLPIEVFERLLTHCNSKSLASLAASSRFFYYSGLVQSEAKKRLMELPQGKFLSRRGSGSTWCVALHTAEWTARAAAQQSCLALGSFHTAILAQEAKPRIYASSSGPEDSTGGNSPRASCSWEEDYDEPNPRNDDDGRLEVNDSEGIVLCAGRGFHGQLGLGTYDAESSFRLPEPEQFEVNVRAIAAGANHSIGYGDGVSAWGLASSGELGHNGWTPIDEPVPKQMRSIGEVPINSVACGDNHTLVISAEDGSLWACGRGRCGQLGFGNFGDAGPLQSIDALRGVYICSVTAGGNHSAAIDGNGNCWVWGEYRSGQLGLGLTRFDPELDWEAGVPWPCLLEKLPSNERVWTISAGSRHTMFTTGSGKVYATGSNRHGQLGINATVKNVLEPHEVSQASSTCLRCDGRCKAVQVAAGGSHSIVLRSCGSVYTAGSNAYGQLGTHDSKSKSYMFRQVESLANERIAAVAAGTEHSGAVSDDENIYLWGRGEWGNLGTNDFRSHFKPVKIDAKAVHRSGESVLELSKMARSTSSSFPTVVHVRSHHEHY